MSDAQSHTAYTMQVCSRNANMDHPLPLPSLPCFVDDAQSCRTIRHRQSSHTKACPTSALPPCSFQLLSNPSAAVQPRHSTSYECTAHATLAKQDRRSYFNIPPPASLTHLSMQACTQLRRRADTHHTKAARTPSVSHMTHLQFDPSCCLFLSDTQGAPHSALPL